ncbi:PLP-dependent transferase, partial [Staphylococcus aureus]|uniref:PLP-dependent transferase n=1 Tax=Staphylococcus aureus TaxID=1280 RepID=UPI0016431996
LSPQHTSTLAKHLKTFPIRFKQSLQNPQKILSFLINQDEISQLYYPPLTTPHLQQPKNPPPLIPFPLPHQSKPQQ